MKYLTTTHYRVADDGIDLSNINDLSLARYISRAEADIDAYLGLDMKDGGLEPHTIWRQAQFDERTLRMQAPNFPVPMRQVVRYRIQVSNLSGTGAGFFANIQNADVSLNTTEGYVEIVPLQSITYSLAPVLIQLGLRPPIIQADIEVGYYIAAFNDTLLPTPGYAQTGVWMATRGFWATSYTQALSVQPNTLPPIPPVIRVNGSVVNSGYTINYTDGSVTFNPPLTGSSIPVVTADYTYTIPDNVRDACIVQVSHLLALRAIRQKGLTYLSSIRVGDVQVENRGVALPGKATQLEAVGLCQAAQEKLQPYVSIAVA